jgi:hypothetical protein
VRLPPPLSTARTEPLHLKCGAGQHGTFAVRWLASAGCTDDAANIAAILVTWTNVTTGAQGASNSRNIATNLAAANTRVRHTGCAVRAHEEVLCCARFRI